MDKSSITSIPWIHRWSRPIMGAIALAGVIENIYLIAVKISGGSAACPTGGCDQVLNSPYASVFGIPLPVFGLMGYTAMAILAFLPLLVNTNQNKPLRTILEQNTWLLMFALGTAMATFSIYLMYILASEIQEFCPYCVASALFSLSLFILAIIGHDWEDIGQILMIGIAVSLITLITTLGVYSGINSPAIASGEKGLEITTTSGPAEIALAKHLKQIGAKEYGAFWCPHCHDQKQLFGKEAFAQIDYVECDPKGVNPRPELCRAAKIEGFPTWEIKGQFYSGAQSLEKLSKVSGYTGPRNFQNVVPGTAQ
ncbi:MAG: vitamin K epoxide reductase family protein [Microcoleaceae cyanobacterium]